MQYRKVGNDPVLYPVMIDEYMILQGACMTQELFQRSTQHKTAVVVSNDLDLSKDARKLLKEVFYFEATSLVTTCEDAFGRDSLDCVILDRSDAGQIRSTIDKLLQDHPSCSIVVCCSPLVAAKLEGCFSLVNVEFIHKPFISEELELRLRKINYQKKTLTELEDSLNFIWQVSDLNPELVYLFDLESQMTIYVNQSFCDVIGCTPLGIEPDGMLYLGSVMRPGERERRYESRPDTLKGLGRREFVSSEYEIRDVNEHWRWIRTRATAFETDESGEPKKILGVAQDISDQKKLNETMSWLSAIVDSADEAIIGKTLKGEVVSWNNAAEELFGYRAEEICGQNISMLLPPNVPDDVAEIMNRVRNRERTERLPHMPKTQGWNNSGCLTKRFASH